MAKYTDLELFAEFIQKVNFLITHKGYTQAAIAEKVGENRGNFNRYVKNEALKPTKKTLQKYLEKLNTFFADDLSKMEQIKTNPSNEISASTIQEQEHPYSSLKKQVEETFLSIQKSIETLSIRQETMERALSSFLANLGHKEGSTPTLEKPAKRKKR